MRKRTSLARNAKSMLRRWRWVAAATLVCGLLFGAGVFLIPIGVSARNEVPVESLQSPPDQLPILKQLSWRPFSSTDRFTEWAGENGALLHEEISMSGGPIRAYYHYKSSDPSREYANKFPGLTEKYPTPSGLDADNTTILCGNKGSSTTDKLEDCKIWGYLARYGQYVVYFEVDDLVLNADQFIEIAKSFDGAVSARI